MSGDINPNPGPVSASTAGKINCLVMNTRSLKIYHKGAQQTGNPVCNILRFKDLVYAENSDVICVNETWLNQNISNSKILYSGFILGEIGLIEVLVEFLSQSKGVKEFKPESKSELQQLEIIFEEITTLIGQRILFCAIGHPVKTQVGIR